MDPAESRSRGRRIRFIVAGIVSAALLAVGAFTVGSLSAPVASSPSTTSVEAGFARDMQVHHGQAVEMAFIVRDLTDDPDVRLLAYDIATSQSQQAGQMAGWLHLWKLPQTGPEPIMTWMTRPTITGGAGHMTMGTDTAAAPATTMPGMATEAQLATLKSLTGVAAEREFLTLMIAHHTGGLEMAKAALARTSEPVVLSLARGIITSQTSEIELMKTMLVERIGR